MMHAPSSENSIPYWCRWRNTVAAKGPVLSAFFGPTRSGRKARRRPDGSTGLPGTLVQAQRKERTMFYHSALALGAFAVAGFAQADILSLAEIKARNGVL